MADQKKTSTKKPVTMIVRRTIRPGREADYEQWAKDTTEDLKKFPGYMDITMIRPQSTGPNKSKEYVLIIRFDTYEHVDAWEKSDVRNKWIDKAKDMTEQVSNQKITGLEYWFPLPEIPKASMPPKYKMITVTTLSIFPLSVVINLIFNMVPFQLPFLLRGLLVSIVLVSLMTYIVMPFMTSLFRGWLFPHTKA